MIKIFFTLVILCFLALLTYKCIENWSNSYSAQPGPLESGCSSCYNIPELHPKYNANKHYKYGLDKSSPYMPLKGYP